MLPERGTPASPRRVSGRLPAPGGERSAGHVTLASRRTADTAVNKGNLLCRPLRGSGSQKPKRKAQRRSQEESRALRQQVNTQEVGRTVAFLLLVNWSQGF